MQRDEIRLDNETLTDLSNYLLTCAVPLPPGAVRNPSKGAITIRTGVPFDYLNVAVLVLDWTVQEIRFHEN